MCDTRDGTSANFLHTAAPQNKSGASAGGKRDCPDNPFDKLKTGARKPLSPDDLSERTGPARDMLTDVNKRARTRGRNCV